MKSYVCLFIIQCIFLVDGFAQGLKINYSDTSLKFAVFNQRSDSKFFFDSVDKPYRLTQSELNILLQIIRKVSDSLHFNVTSTDNATGITVSLRHVFQIIPVIQSNGEIVCFINAICEPKTNWKTEVAIVQDGGSCYYSFRVNLLKRKYFDIQVNGDA